MNIRSDRLPGLLLAAAVVVVGVCSCRGGGEPVSREQMDVLFSELNAADEEIAAGAMADFIELGPAGVRFLEDRVQDVGLPTQQRLRAVRCLGGIPGREATGVLLEALSDPSGRVKRAAMEALSARVVEEVGREIRGAALDPDPEVRLFAIRLLRNANPRRYFPEIAAAAEDHEAAVRREVVGALAEIGSDRAVRVLADLLDDDDFGVSRAAIEKLGSMEPETKAIREAILAGAESRNGYVRNRTAQLLQGHEGPAALAALLRLVSDEEASVRISAIKGLASVDPKIAAAVALRQLDNLEVETRVVVQALGVLRNLTARTFEYDPRGTKGERRKHAQIWRLWWEKNADRSREDWLRDALADGDPEVRRRAARALGEVAGEAALPDLVKALADENIHVADAARRSLEKIAGASLGTITGASAEERMMTIKAWQQWLSARAQPDEGV